MMAIQNMMMSFLRQMGVIQQPLDRQFNRHGILKPGLQSLVHVVDKNGLIQLVAGNAFNENIFLKKGRDKKFPKFLQVEPYQSTYFIICHERHFIASATLRPEENRATEMMISQISIHPDFRNKGYATRLLREILQYLNTQCPDVKRVSISRFMPMGQRYLRRKFIDLSHEFRADMFEIHQQTLLEKLKEKLNRFRDFYKIFNT